MAMKAITLRFNLQNVILRWVFLIGILGVCALLVNLSLKIYLVGTLTNDRAPLERDKLLAAIPTFPDSPRLNARLAEAELLNLNADRDLESAAQYNRRAIALSPSNYEYRLVLASIEEARGNRDAAEQALRKAQELAPANSDVSWRIGNLLVRRGKLDEALPQFKQALLTRNDILAGTLDLIWRASRGNVEIVQSVVREDSSAKLILAQFFVSQKKIAEAAKVFASIDRRARLVAPESAQILERIMQAGSWTEARELWLGLVNDASANPAEAVWNGGFEADVLKNFMQFDWNISRSDYARFSIDTGVAHSGSRALKIDFIGKDTTRFDKEIKQTMVLAPGKKYRLEYFVKTDKFSGFSAPGDLVITLVDLKTMTDLAKSPAITAGTVDWQPVSLEFVVPAGSSGFLLTLKRTPQFSYDEPTKGSIWLDDFSIRER
jgi:Tfp pilus assembly protein PilF